MVRVYCRSTSVSCGTGVAASSPIINYSLPGLCLLSLRLHNCSLPSVRSLCVPTTGSCEPWSPRRSPRRRPAACVEAVAGWVTGGSFYCPFCCSFCCSFSLSLRHFSPLSLFTFRRTPCHPQSSFQMRKRERGEKELSFSICQLLPNVPLSTDMRICLLSR